VGMVWGGGTADVVMMVWGRWGGGCGESQRWHGLCGHDFESQRDLDSKLNQ
jgi:hypothetical protein